MRRINERLVLRSLLNHGDLSKADIARLTKLTPPAIGAIVDALIRGGYVLNGETRRGIVGSPSRLLRLDPAGAFGLGLHIGRRGLEVALVNLSGDVLGRHSRTYKTPIFQDIFEASVAYIRQLMVTIPPAHHCRIAGVGLAIPHCFGFWGKELGYPDNVDDGWHNRAIAESIQKAVGLPVFEENDAAAATLAELEFGKEQTRRDFLYIFIGTYIGGGLVLNGSLVRGPQRLTTTFGPYPVSRSGLPSVVPANETYEYLFRRASGYCLINHLNYSGANIVDLRDLDDLGSEWEPVWLAWIEDASDAIAQAIMGAANVIDVPEVVIDASIPQSMLIKIVDRTGEKVKDHSVETIIAPRVVQGSMGAGARAIGAAVPPLDELIWKGSKHLGANREEA